MSCHVVMNENITRIRASKKIDQSGIHCGDCTNGANRQKAIELGRSWRSKHGWGNRQRGDNSRAKYPGTLRSSRVRASRGVRLMGWQHKGVEEARDPGRSVERDDVRNVLIGPHGRCCAEDLA